MDQAKKIGFLKQYKDLIARARGDSGKVVSRSVFRTLGPVMLAASLVINVSDPLQALENETGIPRDTLEAIIDGYQANELSWGEPPLEGVEGHVLSDGNPIFIGMSWRLYVLNSVNIVTDVINASVSDILPTDTPGVVEIKVDFPHPRTSVRTRVQLPNQIQALNGPLYDSYDVGNYMPESVIGGGFALP